MFDGPEHESYIGLCRELFTRRLGNWNPHEFEFGDVLVMTHPGFGDMDAWDEIGVYGANAHPREDDESAVWLPRLDQWLAMLEEAGWAYHLAAQRPGYAIWARREGLHSREEAITPEEAAAKLYCAVTRTGGDGVKILPPTSSMAADAQP